MADISMETAQRLWSAHREIEVGRKLLADIAKVLADGRSETPVDRATYSRGYTLGVPHGNGERVLNVSPRLAAAVIEAHIAEKRRDLAEATQVARIEAGEP